MGNLTRAALIAAAAAFGSGADAAVIYTYSGFGGQTIFTYSSSTFITVRTPVDCSTTPFTCYGFALQPNATNFITGLPFDEIQINVGSSPSAGYTPVVFIDGAFSAVGTYASLGDRGTLTVSGSPDGVPEPAAWLTMLAGFGLIGATLRRRHTAAARVVLD